MAESVPPLVAYIASACFKYPSRSGGWGVVIVERGEAVLYASGQKYDTTINMMALTAVREALRLVSVSVPLEIITSNVDIARWFTKGWVPRELQTKPLYDEIFPLLNGRNVQWTTIVSDANDPIKEQVDRLAENVIARPLERRFP